MTEYQVVTEAFANFSISSNVISFLSERKFAKDIKIQELKNKLELLTGASTLTMKLSVFDKNDKKVCDLDNDDALLGSYPVESGQRLHVEDSHYVFSEFDANAANVPKFEMSKDEYSKRNDTVQSFLKKNKLGKYNEEEMKKLEEEKKKVEDEEAKLAAGIKVGDRCEVAVPGNMPRRGEVAFVGKVHFKDGTWVGVKYDEPLGKNNGTVDDKQYFECKEKYGGFVRVQHVKVGDYPEEELEMSEDEM